MYDHLDYQTSAELCEQMAAECDTAILAFSCGKDSIASWLQMRRYFKRIIPYYCYSVPGLEFVERSLRYYEDFFETRIYRLPHRTLWAWIGEGLFQPPERISLIEETEIPVFDDAILGEVIRQAGNLPAGAYTGVGVRMADSPMRRVAVKRWGAINHNGKMFYPVYDWKKADMLRELEAAKVKLPVDYKLFGRTFDGLDYRFLKPIKEHFPDDYQRILDWFPLADLETYRREVLNG